MGFWRRNCSVFNRGNTNLAGLANHLNQVYCMVGETRYITQYSTTGNCTPLYNYNSAWLICVVNKNWANVNPSGGTTEE